MSSSLRLDWCTYQAARYACMRWHYSGKIPTPPLVRIGAWESDRFIGCVLFSRGAASHLAASFGLSQTECCELTRVALDTHETPVTRIVSISIRMLRRRCPGLRLIVSFADPNQGHVGAIYQAGNWVYSGTSAPSVQFRDRFGRVWHERQVSAKGYNVQYGSVRRVPRADACERIALLGKHRYLMALDRDMRDRVEQLRQTAPRAGSIVADAPADQTGEGGSTPTPALR